MARKNPFGKITETALSSIKNPGGTSGKVVERAKGTAALGKMVAEQVGRSAVSKASGAASAVVDRAKRRKSSASSLRSVPVVNEPGHTPAENEPPGPVHVTAVEESAEPRKVQGDPVSTSATAKAPAKVAPAKKAPAKKSTATKTPTKASSAKKSPAPSPADVAQVVESAVAEDPKKTAATPAESTGTQSAEKKASPGDTLPPAKKTAAKKTAAKKTTAKKTTAKKTPAKKSPTKKAASKKAASKKTPTEKSAEANPE